uniref:TonB family C-terminal domain protein n=1 Tax=Nostoc flagelliforme str. Sunitezuoqi TaxID=676037 RepID=E7DPH8_9NOSO|nr:tonB family C-terminal domain protein [Nostoc flagelliforme str. Sunitezuoqi]
MLIVKIRCFLILACCLPLSAAGIRAQQRIAVLSPMEDAQSLAASEHFINSLPESFKLINGDLARSVFRAANFENPFNLTAEEARNFGRAVGADYFLFLKTENLRRASLAKPEYYESYLAAYAVSARTGRLVYWTLKSAEAETASEAERKLFAAFGDLANQVSINISSADATEIAEAAPAVAELPAEDSPEAKDFRAPLPYRRLRPVYTALANLYSVAATVDALVDLDENGRVTRVEIARWAGYGLDESVAETIREMKWRAASREGSALPIRVLLRYNFKKLDREE